MFGRNRLIDLDCILDTRVGLLYNRYPEVLKKINYDDYINRDSELMFIDLGITNWHDIYATRNIDDLKYSLCTNLINVIITTMFKDHLDISLGTPLDTPKLSINCYPYKLSSDEKKEFTYTFDEIFKNLKVELVYYTPKDLNLTTMSGMYDAYVTYDLFTWMENNANSNVFSKRCNNFVIESPTILNKLVTHKDIDKFKQLNKNPFHESRMFMIEVIDCSFIDTVGFCAISDLFKELKKTL